ncbi:hypothetical protein CEXT_96921 [Caerostris extrusa]|uniref:Uncharacterized protein n=1 Tax=Caerostris extrusa TaxID=172846 RepID=A0AAV4NNX6_CAEEX|nr:hypothetical protein CEXT_96921 [Caerostris extrusa]
MCLLVEVSGVEHGTFAREANALQMSCGIILHQLEVLEGYSLDETELRFRLPGLHFVVIRIENAWNFSGPGVSKVESE